MGPMSTGQWLAIIGAVATFGLGVMGLVAPGIAATFTSIRPQGLVGRSEIRATYGGFFCGIGAMCLVLQSPDAYLIAGVAWVGAAVGRSFSLVVDRSWGAKNLGGIGFEAAIGGLLLAGALLR